MNYTFHNFLRTLGKNFSVGFVKTPCYGSSGISSGILYEIYGNYLLPSDFTRRIFEWVFGNYFYVSRGSLRMNAFFQKFLPSTQREIILGNSWIIKPLDIFKVFDLPSASCPNFESREIQNLESITVTQAFQVWDELGCSTWYILDSDFALLQVGFQVWLAFSRCGLIKAL